MARISETYDEALKAFNKQLNSKDGKEIKTAVD